MDGALSTVASQLKQTAFDSRGWLDAILSVPGHSSTGFVVDEVNERAVQVAIPVLKQPPSSAPVSLVSNEHESQQSLQSPPPQPQPVEAEIQMVPVGLLTKGQGIDKINIKTIGVCAMRGLVTYMALERLTIISIYWNGVTGLGKCGVAVLTALGRAVSVGGKDNYAKAQDLLEEGIFHLLIAVYDYAVAQFSMIRTAYSVLYAVAPSEGLRLHQLFYRPFKGPVHQQIDDTAEHMKKVRKEFCLIQMFADVLQEMALPSSKGVQAYFTNLASTFTKRLGDQHQSSS